MCTECEDNYEIVNGKCVGTIVENDTYDTIMTLLMFMVIITMLIVIPLTYLGVSKKFPRKISKFQSNFIKNFKNHRQGKGLRRFRGRTQFL